MPDAATPTHAAVRVNGKIYEAPMKEGHYGALEQAVKDWSGKPDDVYAAAEDGYTWGDGKFVPRNAVGGIHSHDIVYTRHANPLDKARVAR